MASPLGRHLYLAKGVGLFLTLALAGWEADLRANDQWKLDTARILADEGDALYGAGDHAAAFERFDRAYALVPAPTIALRHAECLLELRRFVEASQRLEAIRLVPLAPNAPSVFIQAVDRANRLRRDLVRRMPHLRIVLNPSGAGKVMVDGQEVTLTDSPMPIDPGVHEIVWTHDGKKETKSVVTEEGLTAQIRFASASSPVASTHPAVWVSLGIGATGVVVGSITAYRAWQQQKELDGRCVDARCPSDMVEQVQDYNRMRGVSSVSFVVGGVGLGSALVLGLTTTSAKEPRSSALPIRPWVGLGNAGVSGAF